MINTVDVQFNEKMAFTSYVDGHEIIIDAMEEHGGEDKGAHPKTLLLASLGGCTAMDVVSILRKMRTNYDFFNVKVEGELTEEHPIYYKKIKVFYQLKGNNINPDNVKKAVSLSEERYCGVSYMLRKSSEIESFIEINGEIIK